MIDLSHPIRPGMPVYPGDPEVTMADALAIGRDGVAVTALALGSHTGTHVDAPAHVVRGGRTIDEIGLDELVGDALVLRAHAHAGEGSLIDADALGLGRIDRVPPIVAIATGWDVHFGTPRYDHHPRITEGAAERLLALGMRVLAVDLPSVDGDDLEVHRIILGADRVIVENLRGLDRVADRARIGVFPLPLAGRDGAPARAVAW